MATQALAPMAATMFQPGEGSFMNAWAPLEGDNENLDAPNLKARQILLQKPENRISAPVLRKEYVSAADVEASCARVALNVNRVLLALPASLAPQVVGVSIAEAETRLREAINEALQQLHADPSRDGNAAME